MPDDGSDGDERDEGSGDDHRTGSSVEEILGSATGRSDEDGLQGLEELLDEAGGDPSLEDLLKEVKTRHRSRNEGDLRDLLDGAEGGSSLEDLVEEVKTRHRSGDGRAFDGLLEGAGEDPSLEDLLEEVKKRPRLGDDRGGRPSRDGDETDTSDTDPGVGLPARPKLDRETVKGASDILVLESTGGTDVDHTCTPFFTMNPPERRNALFVSLTGSVDGIIGVLQRAGSRPPANVGIVGVNEKIHSTARTSLTGYDMDDVTISVISNPSDLTRLGLTISKIISSWEGSDGRLTVCFRSLTALLQYAELESVFRFLHVLQGRFSAAGAVAHYHMDADAHDQRTIATLRTLFDMVIEVAPDGEVEISKG